MSKIARAEASSLLSKQVTDARYFFLNLAPRKGARLELVMGGLEHCDPDYVVARSRFPFLCIEYVLSGCGLAITGHHQHRLAPSTLFAYGPHTLHEIRSDADHPLVKYFISLAGTEVPAWLRRCKIAHGKSRTLGAPMEIAGAFEALLREAQRNGPNRHRICASLLEVLLLKIEEATSSISLPGDRTYEAFLRCKDYIDTETEKIQTLRQIARAVGAEAYSVCRWFRRYEGVSPYQYLLRRRMNLAAEHLVERGGLVKETAERFGFADPFHFSHRFKAVHGIAPAQLLRYSRGRSTNIQRKRTGRAK
jgi:AraC-like DNA-binding protein